MTDEPTLTLHTRLESLRAWVGEVRERNNPRVSRGATLLVCRCGRQTSGDPEFIERAHEHSCVYRTDLPCLLSLAEGMLDEAEQRLALADLYVTPSGAWADPMRADAEAIIARLERAREGDHEMPTM